MLNRLRKYTGSTPQVQKLSMSANPKFQIVMSVLVIGKLIATHLIIRLVCQAPHHRPIKKGPLNVKKMKLRQEVGGGVKSTSGWKGMYHWDQF